MFRRVIYSSRRTVLDSTAALRRGSGLPDFSAYSIYMNKQRRPPAPDDFDDQVIEIDSTGSPKRRKRGRWLLVLALLAAIIAFSRAGSIYVETLWFGSLG